MERVAIKMKLNNIEKAIALAEQINSLIKEYKKLLKTTMDEELYPLLKIYEKHWEDLSENEDFSVGTGDSIPNKHKPMWRSYEACCELKDDAAHMVYGEINDFRQCNEFTLKSLKAVSIKHKNKNLKIVK